MCLEDELDLLDPVVKAAGDSFHLVGHSYGGAVALLVALRYRSRVRALALYEPTLFAVVEQQSPHPNGVDGIRDTVFAAEAALSAGKREEAAKRFIDFWMGRGSWDAIPAQRQVPIAESVVNVRHWYNALFKELTPTRAFAELQIPVLYMVGEKSPESAQSVARVLLATLPRVRVVRFPGFGHMAPVTHPDPVNDEIARFLREV